MLAVAERPELQETPLLGKKSVVARRSGLGRALTVETDETVGSFPLLGQRELLIGQPLGGGWINLGENVKVVVVTSSWPVEPVEVDVPLYTTQESEPTTIGVTSWYMPSLSTGDLFEGILEAVRGAWQGTLATAPAASAVAVDEPLVLDVPGALQEARARAGLPVQDLAAMFGIKRRQFYNLSSGEQQPESERLPRIGHVTRAIDEVSSWVEGSTQKVRTLLLARLDGDSVYDAAVADDVDRLDQALERVRAAAAEGRRVPQRLAPSHRATPSEAAAVREFLRSTRDDSGAATD